LIDDIQLFANLPRHQLRSYRMNTTRSSFNS